MTEHSTEDARGLDEREVIRMLCNGNGREAEVTMYS